MKKACKRALGALVLCMGTGLVAAQTDGPVPAAVAPATAAAIPIKSFFSAPAMAAPKLSPDGKRMAVLVGNAQSGRRDLVVVTFGKPTSAQLAARFSDADVADVWWVNDERLVFTIADQSASWEYHPCPGLWAVQHDGRDQRRLIQNDCYRYLFWTPPPTGSRELPANHTLLSTLRDGSPDVLIARYNIDNGEERRSVTPLRLNTLTGRTASAVQPGYPSGALQWEADLNGRARMLVAREGGQAAIHWRPADDAPWQLVSKADLFKPTAGAFNPLLIGPDDELYALASRADAAHTQALYRFDRKTLKLEAEPLVGLTGFDFHGDLVFDHRRRKLIGVHYVADAAGTVWFDNDAKQLQALIDKRLPGHINTLHLAECGCSNWVVVEAQSDRQPPLFLLYDRSTDTLERIGASHPDIAPRQMAARDFVRFTARDGLSIPLHITQPAGKGPWPTVVLQHGGPWVRGGEWKWSAESQFLASRGYLVLEPEFRGSAGYGETHLRAGFKQWGLKMQDDVTDATRWAIDKKLADPQRICLAGASYGGYATLMGLIREPELYRCGAAWVAVTDIDLMYDISWSDTSDLFKRYGMPAMIGDQTKDAEQLAQTSPLKQASRLKQPLLLAFGGVDRRVPIEHGTRFRDAVRKTNAQVEWVVYDDEGHGFLKPENRFDFYARLEKFLATHLQAK